MQREFKNALINSILELGKAPEKLKKENNINKMGLAIVGGYLQSIFEISDMPQIELSLDLTYDTVKNLPQAAGWVFSSGLKTYPLETNLMIVEKTIASYLMCLAVNEENAVIIVKRPIDYLDKLYSPYSWAGFDISAAHGSVICVDFLKALHGCVTFERQNLTIKMDEAIQSYATLTGIDLSSFGVDSMVGEFPDICI